MEGGVVGGVARQVVCNGATDYAAALLNVSILRSLLRSPSATKDGDSDGPIITIFLCSDAIVYMDLEDFAVRKGSQHRKCRNCTPVNYFVKIWGSVRVD